ncbi:MAG TPA: hypothetical protein EYQ14_28425 [Gammaproteobacteria bacterium]|nr:hypothetical protein [Gammaproteobacteria bacterium]
MNLTETERLVRRIELYLKQQDASLQPDVMAREYAAEHGAATKRLITCQRIIRGGDHAQALQLAEEPPAVLDVIGQLEFRKAKEWLALCRNNGWPVPEPLDREVVRTLQDAYTKGVQADQEGPGNQAKELHARLPANCRDTASEAKWLQIS